MKEEKRSAARSRWAARIRGALAALWLAAFCAGVAFPASELPETAPLAALMARTQPLHALEKALLGRAGFAASIASAIVAIALLGGTLLAGRFHCSLLCPLGTCQDAAARLASGLRSPRRGTITPRRGLGALRTGTAAFTLAGLVLGLPAAATLLEPYTIFARGFQRSLGDLAALALNGLESLGLPVPVMTVRWEPFAFALAVLPFGAVLVAAAFRSRAFCGALCPAGALLGAANAVALFRVRLDRAACVDCGACSRVCRAHCVNGHFLDTSRCVQCLDCVAVCPTGALRYRPPRRDELVAPFRPPATDPARRRFLVDAGAAGVGIAAALAAPALARAASVPLARETPRGSSGRTLAVPPGALSVRRYAELCTTCGTCVRACPSGVLRHSTLEFGLASPGVPYLDYGRAFCQYECVACSAACPSGAILDREPEFKKREAIGKSALELSDCIVVSKGTRCGACAEHCPSGAVRIEEVAGRPLPVPVLHAATCIGCGACETVCPAEPRKAMTVSGLAVHELADPPRKDAALPVGEPSTEGFAF